MVGFAEENLIRGKDARIDYWVVKEEPQLEKQITEVLQKWFSGEWKINATFSARVGMDQRIEI
ncbi:MAG: hypothetical protein HUU57_08665 [Bdellovibrio sp.]|nr:hypothetical protein [Bdellovibrio sp.]